jgi:hypothetical protein
MNESRTLQCHLRISDSDGQSPGAIRRHVRAALSVEGRLEKLALSGTLIGTPGQMSVDVIEQDDLNLPDLKQREVLLALHNQIFGGDTRRVTSSTTDFEVETTESLALAKIADDLATAEWH